MKHTKNFPKYEGGDNYSVDMVFDNEATISIDRRSRYTDKCNMSREEMEANALLISKAPEMINMLEKCRKTFKEKYNLTVLELDELIKEATTL